MLTASATTTTTLWPTGPRPCDDSTKGGAVRSELVGRVRPHAGDGEVVGVDALGGSHDVLIGHIVQQPDGGVGIDVLVEDDRLVGRVARHRVRVLEGEHPAAGGVGPRAV